MKKFFRVYKYYFILPALIILSIVAGMLLGVVAEKYAAKTSDAIILQEITEFEIVSNEERTSLGEFKLTGYCVCSKCCGSSADGYTATMTEATPGRTIAVDPNIIPYGSIIEINGDRFVAEDCGAAVKGNHIHILCSSHELALAFGVQYAEVYLINNSADYICQ